MMSNSPLVSIIIPTYNRAPLLKEAIESCYAQIYRPIECIIIDDGSSDITKEIVESFKFKEDNDFYIIYLYQENRGVQVARNRGTKASNGNYIQYLDSDDVLFPDKLKMQVEYLENNQACDGVFGDWKKGSRDENRIVKAFQSENLIQQFLTERCIANFSFLMRREMVIKTGEWDVNLRRNQEIDFHLRGVLAGGKFEYQSNIGGLWRIHKGERIGNKTGWKELLAFYQKWENLLIKNGLLNEEFRIKMAENYFWLAHSLGYDQKPSPGSLKLLMEAMRLNPDIPFASTKKMRLLRKIFPVKMVIKFWWIWSKKNKPKI